MEIVTPHDVRVTPFLAGESVALRSIHDFEDRGRAVSFAVAGRVLVDDEHIAVVASPVGSATRKRAGMGSGPNGRLVLAEDWDGSYSDGQWSGAAVVRVHPKGSPWSVWRWHDSAGWAPHWYVNLELPWVRTPLGFDTQDWTLDVIAATGTDGSWSVRYKDEDELEFFVSKGHWSESMRSTIESAGEAATHAALNRHFPFDADWAEWIPDPTWPAVALPTDWRALD